MDNFTYTRHRKLVCCGKWRISAEFVWKNIYALKYHNPLVGGPTRRQKADGRMPVPRSFNEGGDLPRGMKRSGINPSAVIQIQLKNTARIGGGDYRVFCLSLLRYSCILVAHLPRQSFAKI